MSRLGTPLLRLLLLFLLPALEQLPTAQEDAGSAAPPEAQATPAARILQTLAVFDRPESCAFGLDGRQLFVGHCGSDLFGPDGKKVGFVKGRGAISRLAVAEDGAVTMDEHKLVTGLDEPLGLAVLPQATSGSPLFRPRRAWILRLLSAG
jgi:hypothetical protein